MTKKVVHTQNWETSSLSYHYHTSTKQKRKQWTRKVTKCKHPKSLVTFNFHVLCDWIILMLKSTNATTISVKERQTPKSNCLWVNLLLHCKFRPTIVRENKQSGHHNPFFTLHAFFVRIPFRYYYYILLLVRVRGIWCWMVSQTNSIVHSSTIQRPLMASSSYSPKYTHSKCRLCWKSGIL